ncbi:hypothetical protein [Colwellia sp. RSH04]|uniref:hypothetical protein n=1 Tax=Colwellia sp. RSH04 TaxID=2305464 RepID=UPI0011C22718|nr:hypothetical protein [Colwellia sp. RSH04]
MKPNLTVFGTCRVYEPCKLLEDDNYLTLNNKMVYGYTHTTKELLQMLKLLDDDFECEGLLLELLIKNIEHFEYSRNKNFEESDSVIIEVSSIRLFSVNGIYLRSNLLFAFIKSSIADCEIFWKDLISQRLRSIGEYTLVKELSQEELTILENVKSEIQTKESFLSDLEEIYKYININQKVTFVSHFDMKVRNSDVRVPERVLIKEWLSEFSDKVYSTFFNPRFLLEEYGYEKGLLDNAHYTKEFEKELSKLYLDLILN